MVGVAVVVEWYIMVLGSITVGLSAVLHHANELHNFYYQKIMIHKYLNY